MKWDPRNQISKTPVKGVLEKKITAMLVGLENSWYKLEQEARIVCEEGLQEERKAIT